MLAEERFGLILGLLAEKRTATVQELCETLNASESTIRRDLNELARLGKLDKVHGGVAESAAIQFHQGVPWSQRRLAECGLHHP